MNIMESGSMLSHPVRRPVHICMVDQGCMPFGRAFTP